MNIIQQILDMVASSIPAGSYVSPEQQAKRDNRARKNAERLAGNRSRTAPAIPADVRMTARNEARAGWKNTKRNRAMFPARRSLGQYMAPRAA